MTTIFTHSISSLEIILLIGYGILTSTMIITLFYNFNNTVLQTVGNYLIIMTHIFILPSLYLKNEWWLTYTLVTSLIVSLLYHSVKLLTPSIVDNFDRLDISVQNILVSIVIFKIVYHPWQIPHRLKYFIGLSGILVATLGELRIFGIIYLFELLCGIYLIAFLWHIISLVLNIKMEKQRIINMTYTVISLCLSIISIATFLLSSAVAENKYSMTHSIWHVSAYLMLYFTLKSIEQKSQKKSEKKIVEKYEEINEINDVKQYIF